MDFSNYKLRLNIKSCCLYEQITGKNFLKLGNEEEVLELVYCCLVANNPSLLMTYKVFQNLMTDKKVARWITKEYEKISEFNAQIRTKQVSEPATEEKKEEPSEELNITDIASTLIIRYGMDAHYVMYEMELWEIEPYLNAAEIKRKNELVTQRFWTYLTIAPNINTKKVRSPEELVPFDWEKKKEDVKKTLDDNTAAAVAFLRGNRNKKEEKEDGEQ
jgi:hypothetical protein